MACPQKTRMMAMGTYWVLLAVPEWVDEQLHGRLRDSCTAACATASAVRGAPGTAGTATCTPCCCGCTATASGLLALGLLLAQGFEPANQEVR